MPPTSSIAPDAGIDAAGGAGFTLIEMLVTLSLIALIAAFALPRMGGASGAARYDQMAKLEAQLEQARMAARREGRMVRVELDPANRFQPALGDAAVPIFYADGSSNGGELYAGQKLLLRIDWLTGEVRHGAD